MYHARPSRLNSRQLSYGLGMKSWAAHLTSLHPKLTSYEPTDVLTGLSVMFPLPTDASSAPIKFHEARARHLAKYVFPRQFGLHNVFTSPKSSGSYELLPDYDDREVDIKVSSSGLGELISADPARSQKLGKVKTPPRLKGALELMQRMGQLHDKYKYRKVLDRLCPSKVG